MAQKPIAMEQIKQVLQLYGDGVSIREIARRVGISRNSVRKYLARLNTAGKKQHYTDPSTGEQIACEVFVAILPCSGLIFCHAVHSQQTADCLVPFEVLHLRQRSFSLHLPNGSLLVFENGGSL